MTLRWDARGQHAQVAPKSILVDVDGNETLDGEMLSGKSESVSIAPIIAAARAARAALDVHGTSFP